MLHIILWKLQPEKRSVVWQNTIYLCREAIADIQQETPSLTQGVIKEVWDDLVEQAKRDAEAFLDRDLPPPKPDLA